MDASPATIRNVLMPFAAFPCIDKSNDHVRVPQTQRAVPELQIRSTWAIHGGDPYCFTFHAIPHFARRQPPLQISVVVPLDQMTIEPRLIVSLELETVLASPKAGLATTPLARHLINALSYWSATQDRFEALYTSVPFGSKIIVENLLADVREMRIHLESDYHLERQWLSVSSFEAQAHVNVTGAFAVADWADLRFLHQLHDSISVVEIGPDPTPLIFKSVTVGVQYMYHELRVLLTLEPHPNIIPRPLYLVTKRCRFGGKVGICGFISKYYEHNTLHRALQSGCQFGLQQKFRWACGLTRALCHIRDKGPGFYSDLKPNNILLLPQSGHDESEVLLLDFEQRGSWFDWSPPEVRYIEYLEMLAAYDASSIFREKYAAMLDRYIKQDSSRYGQRPLNVAVDGYSIGWSVLNPTEREQAQAFCLGKLLWCMFEEVPSCNTFLTVETFAEGIEQQLRFPQFQRSPSQIRSIITRCTAGAPEWKGRTFPITWKNSRLVLTSPRNSSGREDASMIYDVARDWWLEELSIAEEYIKARRCVAGMDASLPELLLLQEMRSRPSLREVLADLEVAQRDVRSY